MRISVPVLKYHLYTRVTLNLKDMIGCLLRENKIRNAYARLHQAIADHNTILKPDLTIIDGTIAGALGNLPNPVKLHAIVAGFDPVATDTVGSLILEVKLSTVEHLQNAVEHGLGVSDVDKIEIKGTPIEQTAIQR